MPKSELLLQLEKQKNEENRKSVHWQLNTRLGVVGLSSTSIYSIDLIYIYYMSTLYIE